MKVPNIEYFEVLKISNFSWYGFDDVVTKIKFYKGL